MIHVYLYSSCTSCRKTEAMLGKSGTPFMRRDFFKDRFARNELAEILDNAGLRTGDVLSRRSKVYLARRNEIDELSDDALLDLMIEEPTLLRRPIVTGSGAVVVGHNESRLAALIAGTEA